jgi:hypothetical protein
MSLPLLLLLFIIFTVVFAYKKYRPSSPIEDDEDSVLDDDI